MTLDLPCGRKLEAVTWKTDAELWYTHRAFRDGEKPETHLFESSSLMGIMEGKVIINECNK